MCDDKQAHLRMGDEYSNEDKLDYGGGLRHVQEHHHEFSFIARTAHSNAQKASVGMDYCENIT